MICNITTFGHNILKKFNLYSNLYGILKNKPTIELDKIKLKNLGLPTVYNNIYLNPFTYEFCNVKYCKTSKTSLVKIKIDLNYAVNNIPENLDEQEANCKMEISILTDITHNLPKLINISIGNIILYLDSTQFNITNAVLNNDIISKIKNEIKSFSKFKNKNFIKALPLSKLNIYDDNSII